MGPMQPPCWKLEHGVSQRGSRSLWRAAPLRQEQLQLSLAYNPSSLGLQTMAAEPHKQHPGIWAPWSCAPLVLNPAWKPTLCVVNTSSFWITLRESQGRSEVSSNMPYLLVNSHKGLASLVAQMVKNLPAVLETRVRSLGREEPLEKGMAPDSSIL